MTATGFAGLGDMGLPMAARLLDEGHDLFVWNRTPARAAPLVARGAKFVDTPAALMEACSIVGLCLTSHDAVEEVAFGDQGLLSAPRRERQRVIVDFSTGSPDKTIELAGRAAQLGTGWIDAPVSGGVPAAVGGTLILFLGGAEEDLALAAPLLQAVSARATHLGGVGAGQTVKLCNQMIVSANLLAIAEAIAVARLAGVDVARLPEALKSGFADSSPLQIFGPRMAAHSFNPRLGAIALMAKDVALARAMAKACGAATPVLDLSTRLYGSVIERVGMSVDEDLSTLIGLFETLARGDGA